MGCDMVDRLDVDPKDEVDKLRGVDVKFVNKEKAIKVNDLKGANLVADHNVPFNGEPIVLFIGLTRGTPVIILH